MTLMEGGIIDLFELTTSNLNIRANATEDVESVRLELSGAASQARTENVDPYALFGDSSGNYAAGSFPEGDYTLVATPYSGNNLNGTAGTPMTINFSVVSGGIALEVKLYPNPAVTEIQVEMKENNEAKEISSIQIYDTQGRLIRSYGATEISKAGSFEIPTTSLTEGVYFMTVQDSRGKLQKKSFVIEK